MFAEGGLKSCISSSNRGKYKDKGKVVPGPPRGGAAAHAVI